MRLEAQCKTPAKVNLVLRVIGTRPDGYHLIESLMLPVSLYDRIVLRVDSGRGAKGRVVCSVDGPERVADGPDNLAALAARAVLAAGKSRADVCIELTKHIPSGAGLGGGSSDAAAILRVLPQMLDIRLPRPQIHRMATALGADVPFFLQGRAAWATGIGEQLSGAGDLPAFHLCIAVPKTRVNTAWAYRHALPQRAHRAVAASRRDEADADRLRLSVKSLSFLFSNDFERGVKRVGGDAGRDVSRLLGTLNKLGAVATVMSGSGSAVVGAFDSEQSARGAASSLNASGLSDVAYAVRVLNRLPAYRQNEGR